jgi:hypothetical protein
MDKAELIITALQQRIGEMAATYETQIAVLRADITMLMDEKESKEKAASTYSENLTKATKQAVAK